MEKLKVCFVGIGSIALRHIHNLQLICQKRNIELCADAFRRSSSGKTVEGVCSTYSSFEEMPSDYDVFFITNPTSLHLETLKLFHEKGKHFFIEKPAVLIEQIDEAREFEKRSDSIYYVACPLRYNAVIRYIKDNVDPESIVSVRSISSSYLPDWRLGKDYRSTYSAHKELGGGVSIDLIHEWDYLTYLFGWPDKILHLKGKKSSLEIDSDDYAVYIAEYRDKIIELHLDYFGRSTIRETELFTKTDTVIGDIAHNRIQFLKSGKVLDFKEERDDYQIRELEYFLDMVKGTAAPEDGLEHGLKVLKLTQGEI